jgi:tetratricopeptide (TPR) repeat protein
VVFGLDDALLGWLVASAGDTLLDRLRADPARKAMRQLVEDAVAAAVTVVASHLDGEQAKHLRLVLREHDAQLSRATVGSLAELRAALRKRAAALDHREFGESGYLAGLGVDADRLGEELADRIASGIRYHGRTGGPLGPVAEWLWRDELSSNVGQLSSDVDQLRRDLSQLRRVTEPSRSYRGGLPGGTPDFTGRRQALALLAERMQEHDLAGVVVAIHAVDGMAGVGKTELALRAAHQHKHRYPDGQYFLNLHGYTEGIAPLSPEVALEELLRQAGVAGQEIPPDLAGRQARWRALMAGQQALVLLDNVLDADQVRPLLPGPAGCLVLITSRSRLPGLPGARALSLSVLPPDEAIELFTRVAGADRQLDVEAVSTVVGLVGCLPVAVRAVASQVGDDYAEAELADDLARAKGSTGLVEATSPLGAEVSAAFETSLQRLDLAHRQAFRILGLHPGPVIGVPQFAVLADLTISHASQVLRALAARNLITPGQERVGHRRYQLHDLLREFARQEAGTHLSVLERSAAIDRLTSWYATVIGYVDRMEDATDSAPAAQPTVQGLKLDGLEQTRSWLAAEQANLLAFAEHATDDHAADVCCRYGRRLYLLAYFVSARTLYRSAVSVYRLASNQGGQADAMAGLGHVARLTGDHAGAGEQFHAALAIYQQTGNREGQADVLAGLGHIALATGDHAGAGEQFHAALAIHQQTGNREGQADATAGLGLHALATGDYPVADEQLRAALAIYQPARNQAGQAIALWGLGQAALFTGDYQAASEHYRAALTIRRQTGNRAGEAAALWGLGNVALFTKAYPLAEEHYRAALAILQQTGHRGGQAVTLATLGDTAKSTGDYPAAKEYYRASLAICEQIGNRDGQAEALTGLGTVALATDDHPAADQHFRASLAICQQTGNRAGQAEALTGLGHAAKADRRREETRERWHQALAIYVEIGSPNAESVRDELERLDRD